MHLVTQELMVALIVLTLATACRGQPPDETCVDADGVWYADATLHGDECGWGVDEDRSVLEITQTDCRFEMVLDGRDYSGTIQGDELSFGGEYERDGGTVQVEGRGIEVDEDTMSGRADFEFVSDEQTCAGLIVLEAARPVEGEPVPGSVGTRCSQDSDCTEPLLCVAPGEGGHSYCAPSCTTLDDCDPLADSHTNFGMVLPAAVAGDDNHFGSGELLRGIVCDFDRDDAGEPVGQTRYCRYVCGESAAGMFDDAGDITSCACWPNHDWADGEAGGDCVWNPEQECSIFTPCVASETCSESLTCLVGLDLAGTCRGQDSGARDASCIRDCRAEDCDSPCLADCSEAGASKTCMRECCSWSCQ